MTDILQTIKKPVALLLTVLLGMLLWLPQTALAAGEMDTAKATSLTISYPCTDTSFQLFRVADVSPEARFTLCGAFKQYPVSLTNLDAAGWRATAQTLAGYASRDRLLPDATGKTDASGRYTFTGLSTGLYLLVGERHTQDGRTYTPMPCLVSLPGMAEDGSWNYDPAVRPKYESEGGNGGGGGSSSTTINRQAVKIWNDQGQSSARPAEIVVQLLRDGQVQEEVTLSAANGWRYDWSKLDSSHIWAVVEKDVPGDYTVQISREGTAFVITNTAVTDIPEPGVPGGDTPSGGAPDEPNLPPLPDEEIPDENPPTSGWTEVPGTPVTETKLPQTGELWWPVPFLAMGGLVLLTAGIAVGLREREQ